MTAEKINAKEYQFILEIFRRDMQKRICYELLRHSEVYIVTTGSYYTPYSSVKHSLQVDVEPEIYLSNKGLIKHFGSEMSVQYRETTGVVIQGVTVLPDLDRYQIVQNDIVPAVTPWEDINQLQKDLINQLNHAQTPTQIQNVGNSSRILLEKLHYPSPQSLPPRGLCRNYLCDCQKFIEQKLDKIHENLCRAHW